MLHEIQLDMARIEVFCQSWNIIELVLFGSVLREDFRPDSDVDVLVTFQHDAQYTFSDLTQMEAEIAEVFCRRVDLGIRESVEEDPNYIRRKIILDSAQVIYAQQ